MYKTKIIKPSAYAMVLMIQRYLMPPIRANETVKSTTSSMDGSYEDVLEFSSY